MTSGSSYYTRALCLVGLADALGIDSAEMATLVEQAGIPARALHDVDMLIDFTCFHGLLDRLATQYAIPDLGLRWSRQMEPHLSNTGPVLALARFAPNIREWLKDALSYWAWHTNAFNLSVAENIHPGVSRTRIEPAQPVFWPRHFAEHVVANIIALYRHASGRLDDNPIVVRFQHLAPPDCSPHHEMFGCPVEFGCEHLEFEYRTELLDCPTGRLLTPLRSIVRHYIQYRIARMTFYDVSVSTNVALAITSLMGTGKTDITSVAEALVVHPKKLQRLLAQEGTTYSAVLEDVRSTLAQDMVCHPAIPIGQVAGLLGYSALPPFTTAFRKWKGISPRQWRKRKSEAG